LLDVAESEPSSPEREQLVSTATLALGSLGHTMRVTNDPEYPILRDRLLRGALSSEGSDFYAEERTNFVHALGNTGDPSLASEVESFLDDSAPAVRRAAALSLGKMGTDQVAGELLSRFNHERNSRVRGAIAESLVAWTRPSASAMASIGAAVRAEPDENTRYNMARLLGANLKMFPENRAILQNLLRTEQSKRIRQNVADALATASR
jgi:HEAT repeat protein